MKKIMILSFALFCLVFIPTSVSAIESNEEEATNFLTKDEVIKIDFAELDQIRKKLDIKNKDNEYTEEEMNRFATQEIKSTLTNKTREYIMTTMKTGYSYIPGFSDLTEKEVELARQHPVEFVTYASTAKNASDETNKYFGKSQLWQGNGDAFRHTYWNAILVPNFGGTMKGPNHGYNRAKVWTTAHEQNSKGADREMDLYNNEQGRQLGVTKYYNTNTQFSKSIRTMVKQGSLVRIVKGQLTATNGVTGK
ncbi:MAG: DUF6973 domain-containing protein [Bacillota bacterium]